jgi:hypothetical protein
MEAAMQHAPVLHDVLRQLCQLLALLVVHNKHTQLWRHPGPPWMVCLVLLLLLLYVTLQLRNCTCQRLAAVINLDTAKQTRSTEQHSTAGLINAWHGLHGMVHGGPDSTSQSM